MPYSGSTLHIKWDGDLSFTGKDNRGAEVKMGSGSDQAAMSPMDLLLAGIGGCTGIDIIHILKKKRQTPTKFIVEVNGKRALEHPKIFTDIRVIYRVWGDIKEKDLQQAIDLSKEKYCSASAMLGKAAEIYYSYELLSQ